MKRLYFWAFLIATVLLVPLARACSCMRKPECGAFKIHDTLFVGKALSVEVFETRVTRTPFPVRRRIYRFEVSEALTGAPHASEVLEIETGMGGGDCGYGVEIGRSYLIDSSQNGENNRLGTTRVEVMARNLIRESVPSFDTTRFDDSPLQFEDSSPSSDKCNFLRNAE